MRFIINIFSKSLIIISALILLYILYRSEIVWLSEKRSYYKWYFLLSILLMFFGFISFNFSNEIKRYLIIIFFSLILSFYSFEFYIIYKNDFKKISNYKNNFDIDYDRRTKFEIFKDLNEKDTYVVTIAGKLYNSILKKENFFPLSGISNSNTIHCNENGYYSIYKSDRYGFNNPDNEWDEEEIEYLIVGDSFVHGNCVNRPNDISSVLRGISKKNVINLGYEHHRGPLMEYASLREYFKDNVKKVLWVYFEGNDLYDLNNELNNEILIKYLKDNTFSQNLIDSQNRIDNLAKKIIYKKSLDDLKIESLFIKFLKIYNTRSLIKLIFNPNETFFHNKNEFIKILKLTKQLTEANKANLYFVYLPDFNRYVTNYDNSNYLEIKKIIDDLKIPFIDIHKDVFQKEANPLDLFPFGQKGHYNIIGYKKVAEKIYNHTLND